ncbi:Protein CUSTOS [Podarcis lilfordi]|uniref:Protein CUSTOS n=1 Tax=Podarcis lilfordi TaxID=74358 RepID=A0AA35LL17_9SAUR|nr:Protein CUSTOS [Podarcis lilfordi]
MGISIMSAIRSSNSSSGSEEEDLGRLREAAWDPVLQRAAAAALLVPKGGNFKKSKLPSAELSIREKVSDHGQDGNELQTTPEFRAHVAKKLGAILDSSITILKRSPEPAQDNLQSSETEDDGFRLFSSSVPGDCGEPEPQAVGRQRQRYCSSSEQDSDEEWQRCQEATVTAADILKHSGLPAVLQNSSQDHHCPATEPSQKKKRRKKKAKMNGENSNEQEAREGACHGTEGPSGFDGASRRGENASTEDMAVMKKRKKKKKRGKVEIRME